MNLTLDEEQRMYQRTFREFMEKECSRELVEETEKSEAGYAPQAWKKMAGLGWLGLGLSDDQGDGGDMVVTCILCEEMGRALLPVPYIPTVVLGGGSVAAGGREPQRSEILEAIRKGACVIACALMEKGRFEDLSSQECEARGGDQGYVLNGAKTYVEGAQVADYLLLVARTGGGPTAFLLDPRGAGVKSEALRAMGGEKFFHVYLDNAAADPGLVLGEAGKGQQLLDPIIHRAKVALAAKMTGGTSAVLERSVQYARERVQFDKPIGSFQAIAFRLADLATQLSGARLLVYKAAWMMDEGKPGAAKEAAMAKALVSDLYRWATDVGVHTHGGYGYMLEHDVQHYYRRAKAEELAFGDAAYNRALVYGTG
jgi:alkylation response protein AidB-like acyl-CoA dehydrogenase